MPDFLISFFEKSRKIHSLIRLTAAVADSVRCASLEYILKKVHSILVIQKNIFFVKFIGYSLPFNDCCWFSISSAGIFVRIKYFLKFGFSFFFFKNGKK